MKNKIHERVETILWQYSREENKRLRDRTEKNKRLERINQFRSNDS